MRSLQLENFLVQIERTIKLMLNVFVCLLFFLGKPFFKCLKYLLLLTLSTAVYYLASVLVLLSASPNWGRVNHLPL